jgi:glycosyltransferase involved in cell wall biosynthesis
MTDSMQPELSIIICTYNPDAAIFSRCLESITGAIDQFKILEVIIIDNNSSFDLRAETYVQSFLSRHPNARIVSEKKQGLTPARLRGIKEASGDVLLYIDDDNFILPDFFEKGIEIATQNTHIGAWSGQVILEFEKQPEQWTHQYWGLLVYRKFGEDRWSNLPLLADTMPCGAGLFIRKIVADHYYRLHETGKRTGMASRFFQAVITIWLPVPVILDWELGCFMKLY